MRAKATKIFALLCTVIMSIFACTGCWWLMEETSVKLTQVQEPTLSATYNEEYKNYDVYVEGIVQNDSKSAVSGEISITLYDADGNVIGSSYDYIDRIESGAKWRFCAITTTVYEPVSYRIHEAKGYIIF